MIKQRKRCWSVWVGGVEVNDYYLNNVEAKALAEKWQAKGYDDVQAMKMF